MSDVEVWRPISSCPGYDASSLGRIRRSTDVATYYSTRPGRVFNPKPKADGYVRTSVIVNGKREPRYVQRLVCEAFHGPPPSEKHQAAHLNGVRHDNSALNLKWKTPLENETDKRAHGSKVEGEKCWKAYLSDHEVRLIRARVAFGEPIVQTALQFHTSYANVYSIVKGKHRRSAGGYGIDEEDIYVRPYE